MKDRDTQYRLAQNVLMACAFDNWLPGLKNDATLMEPITSFVAQAVQNAMGAGAHLQALTPNFFGANVERQFFLTPAQIGKVSGDITESLCRAVLWNCSAFTIQRAKGMSVRPLAALSPFFADVPNDSGVVLLSLGDSYDLTRLFIEEDAEKLRRFVHALEAQGTTLSYSTPDIVAVSVSALDDATAGYFAVPMANLNLQNQVRLRQAVQQVEGKLRARDIVFAAGVKTSIRSDRMYQFLFEANAWKMIWRKIYKLQPSRFYSLMMGHYGADPAKLRGVEFTSVGEDSSGVEKAIDQVVTISSARDLIAWLVAALKASR